MKRVINQQARKQIRNLLGVLSGGVLAAFLFGGMLLYFYGPTGRYAISRILLSPETMDSISFMDTNSRTGLASRYVFDRIEYSYFDEQTSSYKNISINKAAYETFYRSISDDNSVPETSPEMEGAFVGRHIAMLKLFVRSDSPNNLLSDAKLFQEVQFVNDGRYFRVLLREEGNSSHWVYFYDPGIYVRTQNLFTRGSK